MRGPPRTFTEALYRKNDPAWKEERGDQPSKVRLAAGGSKGPWSRAGIRRDTIDPTKAASVKRGGRVVPKVGPSKAVTTGTAGETAATAER